MNAKISARARTRHATALLAVAGSTFLMGCTDPDVFVPNSEFSGPAGVIEGTLTYSGPPPCTQNGRIVGAAILLGFDKKLLPPPSGLGTSAASIDAVPGEVLFSSIRDKLAFDADGKLRCPDSSAQAVSASATWAIAPLPAGTYQVRSFYDRDGDFDPAYSISNLPTKGDVGGGAIANAAEVLTTGAAAKFTEIDVGVYDAASGQFVMPATGWRVEGIGVTLALPLGLERPVFYPSAVTDEISGNKDPRNVVVAADFQFPEAPSSDKHFIRIKYTAGVVSSADPKLDETEAAAETPFFMPVKNPAASIYMTVEDANRDGVVDDKDSVPESAAVPSLYPLSVFSQLLPGVKMGGQMKPRVIMQGLTLYKNLLATTTKLPTQDPNDPNKYVVFESLEPEVMVALRPAALCIDPVDTSKKGVLLLSHKTAANGDVIVSDEDAVKQGLQRQFGRSFDIVYGCLPQGNYAMNLVYPTGQAWTLPNEAGVCAGAEHDEATSADGLWCEAVKNKRRRLVSQDAWVKVGAPKDAGYCKANPTPKACLAE